MRGVEADMSVQSVDAVLMNRTLQTIFDYRLGSFLKI